MTGNHSSGAQISVMLVDSENLVRRALRLLVESFPGCEVVDEAEDAESALELISRTKASIIVTEIALNTISGVELIHELHRRKSPAKSLVLSRLETLDVVKKALMAGADGYVFKAGSPDQLQSALETVTRGVRYLPPQIERQIDIPPDMYTLDSNESREDPLAPLSAREREIFFLLASGLRNCSIAAKLSISPRTVETHRARIVEKLSLRSNLHLVHYAFRHSLIAPLEK